MMTEQELKGTFDETVAAFRRSWGDTRRANARLIRSALTAYPSLASRIPGDVRRAMRAEGSQ